MLLEKWGGVDVRPLEEVTEHRGTTRGIARGVHPRIFAPDLLLEPRIRSLALGEDREIDVDDQPAVALAALVLLRREDVRSDSIDDVVAHARAGERRDRVLGAALLVVFRARVVDEVVPPDRSFDLGEPRAASLHVEVIDEAKARADMTSAVVRAMRLTVGATNAMQCLVTRASRSERRPEIGEAHGGQERPLLVGRNDVRGDELVPLVLDLLLVADLRVLTPAAAHAIEFDADLLGDLDIHRAATRAPNDDGVRAHPPTRIGDRRRSRRCARDSLSHAVTKTGLTFEVVLQLLLEARVITPDQARDAAIRETREHARLVRERAGTSLRRRGATDAVVHPAEVVAAMDLVASGDKTKRVTERLVMELVAQKANLPFVELDPLKLDAKLAPQFLSRPFARRHTALVVGAAESNVTVAVADPWNRSLVDDLVNLVKRRPVFVISTATDIQRLITDFYGFRGAIEGAQEQMQAGVDIGNLERFIKLKKVEDIEANDQHVVNAVEYLLHYALDQRASDIHIEPHREQSTVRMRIDGVLHTVHTLPMGVHAAVLSRLKMLARMDIAEKRRPQDGRIKTERGNREVELRVSTISVAFGEKMVIRVFDPDNLLRDLGQLGMTEPQLAISKSFVSRPNGMILVTGPTGSGKTSSLYAALRSVVSPEINVVTIEDPIEIIMDQLNQVAVQPKIGLGFAEALRHVLRQDPDVVMVGEVRDPDTASIATQAALTGHLVLATLHTNDAATAITRLVELGVDPYVLSSTLVGVIAQRLVRLVCGDCRVETFLTPDQMSMIGLDIDALASAGQEPQLMVAMGEGCVKCRGTGLVGRTGVFEVLEIDDKIRKLIVGRAGSKEIHAQAKNDGLMTLREAALKKLGKGITSFEEVLRVTVDA